MSLPVDLWSEALGDSNVDFESPELTAAARATFATSTNVLGILRPADCDEVQACVRIGNEHAVPLYPVSRGRNWGLGSRVPDRDCVLLDMSRMNE